MNQLCRLIIDWDIAVSKVTGYERDDRNSILGSGRNYYLHHEVQTGSRICPVLLSRSSEISAAGEQRLKNTRSFILTSSIGPLSAVFVERNVALIFHFSNEPPRHLDRDEESCICSQGVLDVVNYEVFYCIILMFEKRRWENYVRELCRNFMSLII
jgi:hypothetical protein